jgi:hypothetical protein
MYKNLYVTKFVLTKFVHNKVKKNIIYTLYNVQFCRPLILSGFFISINVKPALAIAMSLTALMQH